jgi:uncharacterized membrane protein YfcA
MSFNVFLYHILELISALAGSYYFLKTKDVKIKPFVWYLWIMVFVETVGMYGYILQYNYDNELFIWIKNSSFCSNTWLYNIFSLVYIFLFGLFYYRLIDNKFDKRVIKFSVIIYIIFSLFYFGFTRGFFIKSLPYNFLLETLIVFLYVMLHFKQLLRSEKILVFYKSPYFYLSSGLLLWYLCVTPLFIFNTYFNEVNTNFLEFRSFYLLIANIFLYLCYTFGFLYTIRYKKI